MTVVVQGDHLTAGAWAACAQTQSYQLIVNEKHIFLPFNSPEVFHPGLALIGCVSKCSILCC